MRHQSPARGVATRARPSSPVHTPQDDGGTPSRKPQPLDAFAHDDALLTFASAEAITGLSRSTLYRLEAAGELKFVRIGCRCTRIRAGTLRAFLASRGGAS